MTTQQNAQTGAKWMHRGAVRRAQRTTIQMRGVEITVDYVLDGNYLPATDIDDAETPTVIVKGAQIAGVDCLQILDLDAITEIVERQVLA